MESQLIRYMEENWKSSINDDVKILIGSDNFPYGDGGNKIFDAFVEFRDEEICDIDIVPFLERFKKKYF